MTLWTKPNDAVVQDLMNVVGGNHTTSKSLWKFICQQTGAADAVRRQATSKDRRELLAKHFDIQWPDLRGHKMECRVDFDIAHVWVSRLTTFSLLSHGYSCSSDYPSNQDESTVVVDLSFVFSTYH